MSAVQARLVSGFSNLVSNLGREALRIVLPSACVVCREELPWRDRVASCCADCWSALPKITAPKCVSCAQPLPELAALSSQLAGDPSLRFAVRGSQEQAGLVASPLRTANCEPQTRRAASAVTCLDCVADPLPLDWCDAWGEYRGGLERLLHALKFERHDFLDDALAALLQETMRVRGDVAFDAIAAVPMSRTRERKRGYNQAELLGRALSSRVAVPCDMTLLMRKGERGTQSRLPKRERAANVRGAFAASPGAKGKSILIVDDICTTGETLRACAKALRAAGAARVCAVVVAKAV